MVGHVNWYTLEKKGKSKRRGVLRLRMSFSSEHNSQVAFQEHRHLVRLLLLHELETGKLERYGWKGAWSACGSLVLNQHAAQRGMKREHIVLARWCELATVHQEFPLNFEVFRELAQELHSCVKSAMYSDEETRLFWEATGKVLHSGLNALRKIRRLSIEKEEVMSQLAAILRLVVQSFWLGYSTEIKDFPKAIAALTVQIKRFLI